MLCAPKLCPGNILSLATHFIFMYFLKEFILITNGCQAIFTITKSFMFSSVYKNIKERSLASLLSIKTFTKYPLKSTRLRHIWWQRWDNTRPVCRRRCKGGAAEPPFLIEEQVFIIVYDILHVYTFIYPLREWNKR